MTQTKRRNIVKGHRISWWVYAWNGDGRTEKLRHAANMRGGWSAWDASCECGWESRTGGAIKSYVEREVYFHKLLNREDEEVITTDAADEGDGFDEGCPDCGKDSVEIDEDDMEHCAHCGWRP